MLNRQLNNIFLKIYMTIKTTISDLSRAMVTILNMDELCKKIINHHN